MSAIHSSERKKMIVSFAALYAAAIVVIAVLLFSIKIETSGLDEKLKQEIVEKEPLANDNLFIIDSLLHSRLDNLITANIALARDSSKNNMKSDVISAEQFLQNSIDSISSRKGIISQKDNDQIENIISSFQDALAFCQSARKNRTHSASNNSSNGEQEYISRLKQELQTKDGLITQMKNELKSRSTSTIPPQTSQISASIKQEMAQLNQENSALRKKVEQLNKQVESYRKFIRSE